MNKYLKSILVLGVCGTMLLGATGCDGCNNTEKANDPETRALKLATGALDGNFNPFFYTAQNDGEMIANTQLAMLTTNESGTLVAGQNQPTVVLDYKETKYSAVKRGDEGDSIITNDTDKVGRTEYEFVIKNGIKFSDGQELSMVDVLFNLYVYLDPAYTGSSTIYSTNIQGLKAYRAQQPGLGDNAGDTDGRFRGEANDRINKLINWSSGKAEYDIDFDTDKEAADDLATVKAAFLDEITSDWNDIYSTWKETYKDTERFTAAWQAYLSAEGLVNYQYKLNENNSKSKMEDADGKFYTTLDPWQSGNSEGGKVGECGAQHYIDEIEKAGSDEEDIKEAAIKIVYNNYTAQTNIGFVLTYFKTASTIRDQFTNEQRALFFDQQKKAGKGVKSIEGITTETKSGSALTSSFNGVMKESFPDEEYSILRITINGVDPKAIYNFSFAVAPLHYYSGTWNGKDYVKEAREHYNDKDGNYCFGVETGEPKFMNMLQDSTRVGTPVGAGPYAAADKTGAVTSDKNEFHNNSVVHFVRNTNFETVGTGINNAKIKYVDYKVASDDQIMTDLTSQSIDFGMPNATFTNMQTLASEANKNILAEDHYPTGGYGYIGINPKFVPEYKIRQAIMKAFDATKTIAYYGSDLASVIYRPMTTTSWVYDYYEDDDPINTEYPATAYYEDISEIKQLVQDAGYVLKNGVYTKNEIKPGMSNAKLDTTLKISFIIAGETTNHPAYQMMCDARDILNDIGFDITVNKSANALKDLATGNLAVWAAAWSSSIDPDPYQVYHKDSGATSVLNWNYKNILNNQADWTYEYNIIQQLSTKIDEGRATTTQSKRAEIYGDCLEYIMQLAVEFPTYQRNDLCVYNKTVIDASSLVQNPSYNMGTFDRLWEIDYV